MHELKITRQAEGWLPSCSCGWSGQTLPKEPAKRAAIRHVADPHRQKVSDTPVVEVE